MNATKMLAFTIVALFMVLAVLSPVQAKQETDPLIGEDLDVPTQGEASEAEVKMFFRGATLTPSRASGNSSEEIQRCPGQLWLGRFRGTIIATWSGVVGADSTASGNVGISLWARAPAGAKNAGFRINLYRSGGNMQAYFTNRQDLSANPVKFTAEGTYNQQFSHGDTFDAQLVWLADPNLPVGPSGDGEFLYGNGAFDSHVKITFSPHPLSIVNVTVPVINKETMTIRTEYSDYLHADPAVMDFMLAVSGAGTASPTNLDGPKPAGGGGNTSSVSWEWIHKNDNARSGMYNFQVTMSYDGNASTTNTSTFKVKIPKDNKGGSSIPGFGDADLDMAVIGPIIGLIIAMVVIVFLVKRRSKRKQEKEDEEEEEEDEEED